MRILRDTPSVQARGCATIANMSRNPSYVLSLSLSQSRNCGKTVTTKTKHRFRRAIVKARGVEEVVRAMRSHMDSADVQRQGCRAIRNVAMDSEFVGTIARAGGISCVVKAMQDFEDDESVQSRSIWTLRSLASEST